MDLIAYTNSQFDKVHDYVTKYYGDIPRLRGVCFMKMEKPIYEGKPNVDTVDLFSECIGEDYTDINTMFNKYAGQDVIYIHTRCGDCGKGYDDEDSNYIYCGAKAWEESNKDLFLDHITDKFDSTYCTHYFKAVVNDEYNELLSYFPEE